MIRKFLVIRASLTNHLMHDNGHLCAKFNRPGSVRFELVEGFESMTRRELRQYAADKKVDIAGLTDDRAIIERLEGVSV